MHSRGMRGGSSPDMRAGSMPHIVLHAHGPSMLHAHGPSIVSGTLSSLAGPLAAPGGHWWCPHAADNPAE